MDGTTMLTEFQTFTIVPTITCVLLGEGSVSVRPSTPLGSSLLLHLSEGGAGDASGVHRVQFSLVSGPSHLCNIGPEPFPADWTQTLPPWRHAAVTPPVFTASVWWIYGPVRALSVMSRGAGRANRLTLLLI